MQSDQFDGRKRGPVAGFFEIYVESQFSAAHFLKGYPGDCAELHGHNWKVRVSVACKTLDEAGLGVDFREIKRVLEEVLAGFDHTALNDHPAFRTSNPSSENIARFLYREISAKFDRRGCSVAGVLVAETPETGVFYREE